MVRALLILLALGLAGSVAAQTAVNPAPSQPAKPAAKATKPAAQAKKSPNRPTWAELTAEQQEILAQLKPEWDKLDRARRLKWLGIAKRYPTLSSQQQERVQRRMQAWIKLTPEQRRQARENYKNMAKAPANRFGDLREQWAEYQALSPAERQGLTPPVSEAN
jgi:hypothetical protein